MEKIYTKDEIDIIEKDENCIDIPRKYHIVDKNTKQPIEYLDNLPMRILEKKYPEISSKYKYLRKMKTMSKENHKNYMRNYMSIYNLKKKNN